MTGDRSLGAHQGESWPEYVTYRVEGASGESGQSRPGSEGSNRGLVYSGVPQDRPLQDHSRDKQDPENRLVTRKKQIKTDLPLSPPNLVLSRGKNACMLIYKTLNLTNCCAAHTLPRGFFLCACVRCSLCRIFVRAGRSRASAKSISYTACM